MKTGLLLQTPPRAQWLQLLSLPGNSRGLACLEVPDVQLFLFLQEGVALLEDPCISSGPEARLLPGLSADSLAWGRMSPPGGTCVFGLFANMKKRQMQSSQRVPQLLSQGDNQVFLWYRTVAGRSSNEERKTCTTLATMGKALRATPRSPTYPRPLLQSLGRKAPAPGPLTLTQTPRG